MIIKIVLIFILLVLFKILYNTYHFFRVKSLYKEYIKYVKGSKSWHIKEHKQEIIKLFEKAGIEDAFQPRTEPTGYGQLATSTFSVFRNLTVLEHDIVTIINGDFREAIGVYKQRIFEAFNPMYWIDQLIFLPKNISSYFGIKSNTIIVKSAQLIWFLVGAASLIIGIFFNKGFTSWIQSIL